MILGPSFLLYQINYQQTGKSQLFENIVLFTFLSCGLYFPIITWGSDVFLKNK